MHTRDEKESAQTRAVISVLVNALMGLHNDGAPRQLVLNAAASVLLSLAITLDAEDETRVALSQLDIMLEQQKEQKLAEEGHGQVRH